MEYKPKNFKKLLGIKGFSNTLLKNHFKLYEGYVKNTNFPESKRRFGWEFNGMRLHELYFENLTKNPKGPKKILNKIKKNFKSYKNWEKDFKKTASMRGIGWVILYQDKDKLFNTWINEHDVGHLAGCEPLLVLDVFEHAFITDYGLNKADYIKNFLKSVNWSIVEKRLK